jgi:hypothetical protein
MRKHSSSPNTLRNIAVYVVLNALEILYPLLLVASIVVKRLVIYVMERGVHVLAHWASDDRCSQSAISHVKRHLIKLNPNPIFGSKY